MTKRSMLIISLAALIAGGTFFVASRTRAAGDLTPKEARKLIARMAGIELPSDAVRVKDISTAGNTAIVVAQVETAFRLVKDDKDKWRIAEIRTGDRRWEDLDTLVKALNVEKTARARAELESIATALESYRRERGFYVESKSEAALIDNLNPHYLARVIRVDPWHQPYEYEGERNKFTLRSVGPDGQANTADDVTLANSSR
ncbi:MAG TPA: type II secretion system protein GspG [Pyrinomonadaceae bacterium]|nr:type II secretion system protein GspG [Pyrinomonadaceae bacterium]